VLGAALTEEMMRIVRAGDEYIGKDAEYMELEVKVITDNNRCQAIRTPIRRNKVMVSGSYCISCNTCVLGYICNIIFNGRLWF
jgi:TPP-dependent indolepyruvate ferredoxin oxidoreductase alpha subunit